MANWCTTCLRIKHKSEEDCDKFLKDLRKWRKGDFVDTDEGWLGFVCVNSGIATYEKDGVFLKNGESIFCRGTVDEGERMGDTAVLMMESAWSPAMRMWLLILEKHYPEARITYWAEETGCGLYATNDSYLAGTFEIDVFDTPPEYVKELECETIHEASREYAIKFLQDALQTKESDLNKLLEIKRADEGVDWFCINEWEELAPEEWS